ncbi:MAG: GntR family transcriptional regulator [Oscillospiraceae bacterium]
MHIEKIQQNNAPRVPELIMQALVKAIEDGHIRVGEDMPSERDLAEMLGVGRGSSAGVPGYSGVFRRHRQPGQPQGAAAGRGLYSEGPHLDRVLQ